MAEYDDLFATALRAQRRLTPTRLRMFLDPASEERARDLTGGESRCCSFYAFTFTSAADALELHVEVPLGVCRGAGLCRRAGDCRSRESARGGVVVTFAEESSQF